MTSREVVCDRSTVVLRGSARDAVVKARAERRLEPWTGWDAPSRCGGLIGVVAQAFGHDLVSVAGAPMDLLWLAEWVFDAAEDGAWVERFWGLVEDEGVRAGAAWRVVREVISRWGASEKELEVARRLEAAGHGISEEVLDGVEAVLGYPVLGCDRTPAALVRYVMARGGDPAELGRMIEQELRQTVPPR